MQEQRKMRGWGANENLGEGRQEKVPLKRNERKRKKGIHQKVVERCRK